MNFAEQINDIRRRAGLKEQIDRWIRSDYYEGSFPIEYLNDAYDEYLDYMQKHNMEPEVDEEMLKISPENYIDHVLYHAELNGFDVEDFLVK